MIKNNLKILGDLEMEIMEIIWQIGPVSVRQVLLELQKKKKIAYTTVMTVMSRLGEKGILKRKMDKAGAFIYISVKDKESFLAQASGKMIKGFLQAYGDVAVAQFVDALDALDPEQSTAWKNKLKQLIK